MIRPLDRSPVRAATRRTAAVLPAAALALVLALDAVTRSRDWSLPVVGVLDEPAHLATAWLFLAAFLPTSARAWWPWALAGSVLIDVDHIPFLLWGGLDGGGGRPVTHSLATVVVLLAVGALGPARWRVPLLGLGVGVALHLVRDLATGPGVQLLEPLDSSEVRLPYGLYVGVLAGVATVATVRRAVRPRKA